MSKEVDYDETVSFCTIYSFDTYNLNAVSLIMHCFHMLTTWRTYQST